MTEAVSPKLASGARMASRPPDFLRTFSLFLLAVALVVVVFLVKPTQIPLIVQKLCLAAAGANLGYWIDRLVFPYSRPGDIDDFELRWKYEYRRAFIIVGTMIALEMGS